VAAGSEVYLHIGGAVNVEAELQRLDGQIAKLRKTADKSEAKLQNSGFLEKAPAEVIEKEKAQLAEIEEAIAKLASQRGTLAAIGGSQ